jgi:limonene-1,2-epoxide hydrolase
MNHAETIREYYAAWVRDDVAAVMSLCSDDVVAGIMPGEDLVGKQAVIQFLDKFAKGMTNKRYDIHAIVVEGDVGMLEGVENYIKDGKPISLPFMTVFRFKTGKVCSWRDYFDMTTLLKQLQA